MLTGLIGTGNAILLAGLALIIKKFRGHIPGKHSDNALLTIAASDLSGVSDNWSLYESGRFAGGSWALDSVNYQEDASSSSSSAPAPYRKKVPRT